MRRRHRFTSYLLPEAAGSGVIGLAGSPESNDHHASMQLSENGRFPGYGLRSPLPHCGQTLAAVMFFTFQGGRYHLHLYQEQPFRKVTGYRPSFFRNPLPTSPAKPLAIRTRPQVHPKK